MNNDEMSNTNISEISLFLQKIWLVNPVGQNMGMDLSMQAEKDSDALTSQSCLTMQKNKRIKLSATTFGLF